MASVRSSAVSLLVLSFGLFVVSQGGSVYADAQPSEGWVDMTLINSSGLAWGDVHFEIGSLLGSDVSNVDIVDVDPFELTTSQSPFTYVIDNLPATGSTLDYYFYSDPVLPGDSVDFAFYIDNTTDKVNFTLTVWPTVVPEPATIGLMALGGLALLRKRR